MYKGISLLVLLSLISACASFGVRDKNDPITREGNYKSFVAAKLHHCGYKNLPWIEKETIRRMKRKGDYDSYLQAKKYSPEVASEIFQKHQDIVLGNLQSFIDSEYIPEDKFTYRTTYKLDRYSSEHEGFPTTKKLSSALTATAGNITAWGLYRKQRVPAWLLADEYGRGGASGWLRFEQRCFPVDRVVNSRVCEVYDDTRLRMSITALQNEEPYPSINKLDIMSDGKAVLLVDEAERARLEREAIESGRPIEIKVHTTFKIVGCQKDSIEFEVTKLQWQL